MQYHLLYNAAAHFAAQEKYPDGLGAAIAATGMDGFDAVCWALGELSMQAELYRRNLGYDAAPALNEETARSILRPRDVIKAKTAIYDAMLRGLGDHEDEEVDEVLLELQKKTERG